MRATILRWFPVSRTRREAFGFAKPPSVAREIFVSACEIIEGVPHIGAEIDYEVGEADGKRWARRVRVLQ